MNEDNAGGGETPRITIINGYDAENYKDVKCLALALDRIQQTLDSDINGRLDAMNNRLEQTEHVLEQARNDIARTHALLAEMGARQQQLLHAIEAIAEDTQYLCNITTAPNPLQKERLFNLALRTKTAIPFQKQGRP